MSRHENWRIRKYWEHEGGLLIEGFQVVPKKKNTGKGKQIIDGIIVLGEEKRIQTGGTYDFTDKDIIIIQTEKDPLGMQFLGEAFSSREAIMRYQPRSIRTVAICSRHDEEMYRLCEEFHIEMLVVPEGDA